METEPGAGEMEKKTKTRRRRGGRQKEIPRSGQRETESQTSQRGTEEEVRRGGGRDQRRGDLNIRRRRSPSSPETRKMKMKETAVVGFGEVSPRSGDGDLTRVQDDGSGSLGGGRRWVAGGDRRREARRGGD